MRYRVGALVVLLGAALALGCIREPGPGSLTREDVCTKLTEQYGDEYFWNPDALDEYLDARESVALGLLEDGSQPPTFVLDVAHASAVGMLRDVLGCPGGD